MCRRRGNFRTLRRPGKSSRSHSSIISPSTVTSSEPLLSQLPVASASSTPWVLGGHRGHCCPRMLPSELPGSRLRTAAYEDRDMRINAIRVIDAPPTPRVPSIITAIGLALLTVPAALLPIFANAIATFRWFINRPLLWARTQRVGSALISTNPACWLYRGRAQCRWPYELLRCPGHWVAFAGRLLSPCNSPRVRSRSSYRGSGMLHRRLIPRCTGSRRHPFDCHRRILLRRPACRHHRRAADCAHPDRTVPGHAVPQRAGADSNIAIVWCHANLFESCRVRCTAVTQKRS